MKYRDRIASFIILFLVATLAITALSLVWRNAFGLVVCAVCADAALVPLLFRCLYRPLMERREMLSRAALDGRWKSLFGSDGWKALDESDELETVFRLLLDDALRQKSAQVDEQQAQLLALQSQINSHFLYNTLECVRGQAVLEGNVEIADMLETLSRFYRYNVNRKESVVTLQDEISNSQNYMKIQQYRFEGRFSLDIQIDEGDDSLRECFVPKLMLQPIIENSILHAFENRKRGTVTISVASAGGILLVTLSDDGEGMDAAELAALVAHIRDASGSGTDRMGIALSNVEKRIKMLFGDEYGIGVYSTPGLGTDVEITLPRVISRD